ncbi:Lipopolysaccharide export system protein LptC [Klebsiella pneumoniae]|nr:Lipopolysaccharide export system protein LptC [Klebsiella pneumoniae]
MSKTRRWVIILLSLLALILIGLNLANTDDTAQPEVNLTTLRIKANIPTPWYTVRKAP